MLSELSVSQVASLIHLETDSSIRLIHVVHIGLVLNVDLKVRVQVFHRTVLLVVLGAETDEGTLFSSAEFL